MLLQIILIFIIHNALTRPLGYKVPDDAYKEFGYVKYMDPEVESIVPFLGTSNNSQIFCEKLS